MIFAFSLVAAATAHAGPVVREATGINAAAIQTAVNLFRNDLGNPNNGATLGSQVGGRREITWDGGGAGANATTFPIPMTTFANRGAVFVTPGSGFEISGQPSPEFGDLNGTYPSLFAPFSLDDCEFRALDNLPHDALPAGMPPCRPGRGWGHPLDFSS